MMKRTTYDGFDQASSARRKIRRKVDTWAFFFLAGGIIWLMTPSFGMEILRVEFGAIVLITGLYHGIRTIADSRSRRSFPLIMAIVLILTGVLIIWPPLIVEQLALIGVWFTAWLVQHAFMQLLGMGFLIPGLWLLRLSRKWLKPVEEAACRIHQEENKH